MGFSVSGSAVIIFAGLFIAFGMWHSAVSDGFERVTDAQQDAMDGSLAEQNTAIEIENASYSETVLNATTGETAYIVAVNVTHTGATSLSLNGTDVLLDNDYRTDWEGDATVDGDAETDLWLPGEKLAVAFNESSQPNRVKLVTESGVSVSAEVTAA
jgi:flagellar protein FlaF